MGLKNSISNFVLQLFKAALAAISALMCSKYFGASGRGEISLVLLYVQILMILNEFVGGAGLPIALKSKEPKAILPFVFLWSIAINIMGVLFIYFYLGNKTLCLAMLGMALPQAWLSIYNSIYQYYNKVIQRSWILLSIELLKISMLLLIPVLLANFGTTSWYCILIIANAVGLVLALVYSPVRLQQVFANNFQGIRVVLSAGFWSQLGHLMQFMNYRMSFFFLEKYWSQFAVGIYANMFLIADAVWILGNSFGAVFHAEILNSNSIRSVTKGIRLQWIINAGTIGGLAAIFILPQAVYTQLMGKDYMHFKEDLIWMAPAIVLLSWGVILQYYMHAAQQLRKIVIINIPVVVCNVLFLLVAIPRWGIPGAAISLALAFSLQLVLYFFILRRSKLNIVNYFSFILVLYRFLRIRK